MPTAQELTRYTVLALVAVAALLAFAAMAVQRRMINPFSRPARLIRDVSDPFIKPIERRVLRSGGNPQQAPLWLLGLAIVLGIVLITAVDWSVGYAASLRHAASLGGRSLMIRIVDLVLNLLMIAIIIRVIGSWVGAGQYNRWMRPFYLLTEWFLGPLRRVLPAFGPIDLSPIIAWLLIMYVVRPLLIGILA